MKNISKVIKELESLVTLTNLTSEDENNICESLTFLDKEVTQILLKEKTLPK